MSQSDPLAGTWWEKKYPDAFKKHTWEEDFQYRISTGGNASGATDFANRRHPGDQREAPADEY